MEIAYGPTKAPMDVMWPCDGTHFASKGVRGGENGILAQHFKVNLESQSDELPNIVNVQLVKGEYVKGNHASGGGYGDPLLRDPKRTLFDVMEGYETLERACDLYGVEFTGELADETLRVDVPATLARRNELLAARG
jgi:N-methylhydantoinase B